MKTCEIYSHHFEQLGENDAKSCFHEIFLYARKISRSSTQCHSLEIAEILSHTFSQKFRESNGFTKEITI